MSSLKISPRRRSDYKRPRRAIPSINRQKRELKAALEREKELIGTLINDARIRRAFERGMNLSTEPLSVWLENDHSWGQTELGPKHLPKWERITEAFKMFIACDVAMEFNACYAFTAHIAPDFIHGWTSTSHGFMRNVAQRLGRYLKREGLEAIPYCYLVETRNKTGRSMTRPHLHGFFLAEDASTATRFKIALEKAFNPTLKRTARKSAIQVLRGKDKKGEFTGSASWVSYMIKNVDRWDARLGKRRIYMSRSLTEIAHEAWLLRREE